MRVRKRLVGSRRGAAGRPDSADSSDFVLDVSFEAPNGITTLLGASGAGKTTTLRLVAGITRPDEGAVSVGGRVFYDSGAGVDLPIRRRRVGFVFQDYALFPHMNAEQNVAFGVKAADGRARRERARQMLALFRVGHAARRLPHELSGGEQQRVALARALASDPLVVLLDEPLSAVDVETRARLVDEIEAAQRAAGVPFVYVTHNREEAERLGDYSVTLEGGRVVREERLR
ncbi:MAG TPA: ABC transporter ATP-binding protein [Pyrinomonadaceae bacterium]